MILVFFNTSYYPGTQSATDINGDLFTYLYYRLLRAFYGSGNECEVGYSCYAYPDLYLDASSSPIGANLHASQGYEYPYDPVQNINGGYSDAGYVSFLIKFTIVPIPSTVWLFSSGFIGLIGLEKRKKV